MHIASIGIDLGKTVFHLVALGERNKVLLRRKFSRTQLLAYTTQSALWRCLLTTYRNIRMFGPIRGILSETNLGELGWEPVFEGL